jgi:hypothetical protein
VAFLVNIGGFLGIVNASDPNHIDIHVGIHQGGILTVTADSPKGKAASNAAFAEAVNRIRG